MPRRYRMLKVRSRHNSVGGSLPVGSPLMLWDRPERIYLDGPSLFGRIYLHVPFLFEPSGSAAESTDVGMCRVYPRDAIVDDVETAMLHKGEWYWIARSRPTTSSR